jgi:hypothetical protein
VPAEETVFTGGTVWNVRAWRQAGVACIGLLRGGTSRDELTERAGAFASVIGAARAGQPGCGAGPTGSSRINRAAVGRARRMTKTTIVRSTGASRYGMLGIYLNDHLAGATAGSVRQLAVR